MNRITTAVTGIVAILVILFISHTIRRHNTEVKLAQEKTLRAELTEMRQAISRFEQDHRARPRALRELVPTYLRAIPIDPITNSASSWRTTIEESVRVDDFSSAAPAGSAPALIDVHSGAAGRDSSGRRYSDY